MNVNLLPFAMFWGVLALVVVCLIFYRRAVTSREDDSIHLEGGIASDQITLAHRLELIDRWGKTLTIAAVVFGLALAGVYLYQVWNTVPTY
ncbi:MAG: hypothetical protein ABSH32_09240 [Bryobacteraceae bacterium]|jgi:uncharacterized membrane protein YdcZ (DUF606 family)